MLRKKTKIALAIAFLVAIAFPASAVRAESISHTSDAKSGHEEKIKKLDECRTTSEAARKAYRQALKDNLAKRNEAYKVARVAREAAIKTARESYASMAGMKQDMISTADGKDAKKAAREGFAAWKEEGLKERRTAIAKAMTDYTAAVKAAQEAYLAANKAALETRTAALAAAHKPCVLGAETGSVLGVFTSLLAVDSGSTSLDEQKALQIEQAEKNQKAKEEREAKRAEQEAKAKAAREESKAKAETKKAEAKAKAEAAKAKREALRACNEAAAKTYKEAITAARTTHKEAVKAARESYKAMASQKETMIKDAEGSDAKKLAREGFNEWKQKGLKERNEAITAANTTLKEALKAANDTRKAAVAACKAANTATATNQ